MEKKYTKQYKTSLGIVEVKKQRTRWHVACGGKHALLEQTVLCNTYEKAKDRALALWNKSTIIKTAPVAHQPSGEKRDNPLNDRNLKAFIALGKQQRKKVFANVRN